MSSVRTGLIFKGLSAGARVRIGSPLVAGRRPSSSQRQGLASMMLVESERVDHEGVPEQVHVLAGMPDAVGSPEVEAVLQPSVDGLGIAAPPIQTLEVGITRRDRTDVLCPVELATFVDPIGLESHHDRPAAVGIG